MIIFKNINVYFKYVEQKILKRANVLVILLL